MKGERTLDDKPFRYCGIATLLHTDKGKAVEDWNRRADDGKV